MYGDSYFFFAELRTPLYNSRGVHASQPWRRFVHRMDRESTQNCRIVCSRKPQSFVEIKTKFGSYLHCLFAKFENENVVCKHGPLHLWASRLIPLNHYANGKWGMAQSTVDCKISFTLWTLCVFPWSWNPQKAHSEFTARCCWKDAGADASYYDLCVYESSWCRLLTSTFRAHGLFLSDHVTTL
jgi:hypothetical protein